MATQSEILEREHWDAQYREEDLAWETNRPSTELRRVVHEYSIQPSRALELGCGTGVNALWLAGLGFEVTAIDLSPTAIRWAQRRARFQNLSVQFLAGDMTRPGVLKGSFDFFLDHGCYHAVRLADRGSYFRALASVTRPRALGLVLTGNAREPEYEAGPPVLNEEELRREWGGLFEIIHLRAFRWDAPRPEDPHYLSWSCLVQRRV